MPMSDDRGSSASSTILAFLLGGLAGAAAAILLAPRSGRETRELLGERLREGAERGRELGGQVASRGRDVLDDAGEYVSRGKETVERQKDRLAAAFEAGRQAYREEKEKA
jgi:gas vesicle protein